MRTRTQISRRVRETVIFAMLGTLMFVSKLVMELLPNMHLLGTLTVLYTLVFRVKALIPIYVYVLMNGLYAGFAMWWMPYLYIWAILWGMAMLIPRGLSDRACAVVYPIVCALHGFMFGVLYAPLQALMFGLNFDGMIAWIAAGMPFDIIHGISNFVAGMLILPLSKLLRRLAGPEYAYEGAKKEITHGTEDLQNSEN